MEEDRPSSSKPTSSFLKSGDRQVIVVELRPGETTYVSWKKLMKDADKANKNNIGSSKFVPDPLPVPRPIIESRIAPGQAEENKGKDEPAPNRFSAVIEKIERLYMGKESSDDEELNDIPDNQYDTEDSFIDDAELDEYFEVDNSAIKHDGFFVNRGKLECINEHIILPNQQSKKRQRKDLGKAHGENDGHVPNKHAKLTKAASSKLAPLVGENISSQNLGATSSVHFEDVRCHKQLNASVIFSKKKSVDHKTTLDPSSIKVSNGDASVALAEAKVTDKLKTDLPSKNVSGKLKDVSGHSDASQQKYHDQIAHAQFKSQSGKPLQNFDELEPSGGQREKNGSHELPDINVSEGKYPMQTTKASHMHRKDSSSVKPKGTMLEKAIRELEKLVSESRPPAMENQEADHSSQAVKRRLPRDIKLKLAKVARLAQASQGKISKELINRLMSILGHLIQLRTLQRNLKIMITMGLSAKQEKDDMFQQIKKEIVEMIEERAPTLDSKAFEQQARASDDFQEIGSEEKVVIKKKYRMDSALEDKICDLYDLFVDGLDEDAGPKIRKLYVELAELWPKGFMDNHEIKRGICRAKERKRDVYRRHQDQEEIKRKKMSTTKIEESVRVEASSIGQPQLMDERLTTDSGGHNLALANRPISSTTTAAMRIPSPSANASSLDRLKQEKLKGSSSNSMDETKMVDDTITKKMAKRKPEQELDGTYFHQEKLALQSSDERHKSHKLSAILPHKLNLNAPPNFDPSSLT